MNNKDVIAIVICFHPNHLKLVSLLESINSNVSKIIIYNNGGVDSELIANFSEKIVLISRGENVGLGEALNYGCDVGFRDGYRFLISFDQDSSPSRKMIDILKIELLNYQVHKPNAIAIGPQLIDRRNGRDNILPFIYFRGLKAEKWYGEGTKPVSHLITSGCLIDLRQWGVVDRFLDDLFIDYVDNNWSWRVGNRGYSLLGTSHAQMPHEISENFQRKGYMSVNKYSPFRRYFQMRNATYHLCYENLTIAQRLYVLRGMAVTLISSLVSDKFLFKSLWQCLRGLGHGVIGKLGAK